MSVTRRRSNRRPLAHAALLASASFLSLTFATEAQAQCVASPAQPLNNITTPVTAVQCTGANTGQTIVANTNATEVTVSGAGSTLNNSAVTLNGDANSLTISNGASAANLTYANTGNVGILEIVGTASNLTAVMSGLQNNMSIFSGGAVTAAPGGIFLSAGTGQVQAFTLNQGGTLTSTGNLGGAYLLTGGTGNQIFGLNGTVSLQGNGLFIDAGDGDDVINVGTAATFISGVVHTINGGAGNDRLILNGSGNTAFSTINVERLDVLAGVGGTRTLGENNSFTQVNLLSGTLVAQRVQALGQANSLITLSSGTTLSLNFTAPTTVTNGFAGSGTILHNTLDSVTYGGSSSGFSGVFNILGGTAIITSSDAFGTGTISNGGTISWADFNLTNNIGGTGRLIYTGVGTGDLSGTNSFSGGIDIQSGSLRVVNVGALGTGTITTTTGGVILQLDNSSNQVLANNLTGALALAKTSGGILDVTGTNTYTGGTLIDTGAIRVDSFARLGTGQVVANVGGSLILNYNSANQLLQTTAFLSGAGSFIKEGSGDMVIDVANTYTGGTTIRAGRLGLNDGDALGTGAIQINSGAVLGIGGVTLQNEITGSGSIVKTASNQATLGGDNSGFSGLIDIQSGSLVIEDGRSAGVGNVTIGGGTSLVVDSAVGDTILAANLSGAGDLEKIGPERLTLTGTNTLTGTVFVGAGTLQIGGGQNIGTANIVLSGAAGVLDLNTSGSTTLGNLIAGNGRVVKTGTGTVFITGANTYAGGTDIQQGAIRVTDVSVLGTGAITVQAGAALDLSIAGAQTLSQNVTGAGILRKSDTGDLTLLANGLTGGVDIVGGRVIVSTTSALGGGPVTSAAGTRLVFDNAATEVSNTVISGAGGLTKTGTGLLVMNNANSFTGGTTITSGRIGLNDGLGLGTGTITIQQGAILGVGGVNVANAIVGAGRVIKTANNTATLTGNNAYSGGTELQQGNLRVTNPGSLGTGGVVMASGTALIVDYSGANNAALGNVLSGAGALIKDGSGTAVINTAGNTYSGGTTINAGRLALNFGDGLGTGGVTIASGAELAIGNVSVANNVSGAGRIIKTSSGTGALTGTNTHTGGIDIQGGILAVSGNGALGTGAISIAGGASLDYTNTAAATFSNGLSGAGTFNKLGAGQLTFGSNFTLGALNAQAGRIRINAVATTNATVASGATLDGTGRIIGNLVNNGTVAPGNSIGTLTVQGNYTHNAGSVLEIEFDANGNIDLLDVTGNAVLNGGALRFVGIGGAEGQGGTFLRTVGTLTGTFSTVETVGAQLPLAVFYQPNAALMAPSVLTARPSTFNAQSLAAADTALGFIESLGLADARHGRGNRLWLSGFGAWGNRSASGTTLAYDHETRGISGGINLVAGGGFTLGAAVGWADGEVTLGSNGGGGDQTHLLGSITARYQGEGLTLGAGAVYGQVDQTTLRNVSFNGFSGSVDGATESTIFGGFVEVGVPLGAVKGWNFEANARGSVIRQEQDGYTESGTSPLRLRLDDLATTTVEGQARLIGTTRLWDASRGAEEDSAGLDLRVDLGLRYLAMQGDREIPVVFAVSNAGIVLQGDTRDTVQGAGGIALDYTTGSGARFSLGYRGEIARTDRHTVQAGVSIAF